MHPWSGGDRGTEREVEQIRASKLIFLNYTVNPPVIVYTASLKCPLAGAKAIEKTG